LQIELEQYILPQIYKQAFESVEKPEEDVILMEKCKEFAGIGQVNFFLLFFIFWASPSLTEDLSLWISTK